VLDLQEIYRNSAFGHLEFLTVYPKIKLQGELAAMFGLASLPVSFACIIEA
jgi:hypothetical protein